VLLAASVAVVGLVSLELVRSVGALDRLTAPWPLQSLAVLTGAAVDRIERPGPKLGAVITVTRDLAMKHDVTNALRHFYVFPGEFPVDKRHNAKIEREKLAMWAKEKGPGR